MTSPVRWGFIATGAIAGAVARDLEHLPSAVKFAVASRDLDRAREFATLHGFERAYGSYADLIADPEIDAVYVATPHAQHYRVTRDLLDAGTPVLVEKAFTCTQAAAADLVGRARVAEVFLMEAMWVRFQPAFTRMRALVADGAIGEVRAVQADLGFVNERPQGRLVDPANGGGVLLDCGVYLVSLAQWFLGPARTVAATGRIGPTGVDLEAGLLLGFEGEAHAILSSSFTSDSPGGATIVGTGGRVVIEPRFHHPPQIRVEPRGGDPILISGDLVGSGYWYEFAHVQECLAAGLTESPVMALDQTLEVMATLDRALDQLGAPHLDEA